MLNEITKEVIREIADMADKASEIREVGGIKYSRQSYSPIIPEWQPSALELVTLASLADYLNLNPEDLDLAEIFVHIDDPSTVRIVGGFEGTKKTRPVYAVAKNPSASDFQFDRFRPAEEMTIALKTMFVPSDDLAAIVYLLTKIDIDSGVTAADDGVSQNIQIRKGMSGAIKEGATTKGFYRLKPYRTFLEIDQPESEYLFRLRDGGDSGPLAALFTAGGQLWKLAATASIKNWLKDNLRAEINILA